MENILTGFHAVEERVRCVAESKDSAEAAKMTVLYDKAGPRVKKTDQARCARRKNTLSF